jgi:thiol-disulfide isomerase/thioredoxin
VYDDRGKPVPNAKVRLAVGSAAGGKVVLATTDRSGAFTLHGLRPGSSYTLIAEYEDEDGMISGRAQAKAPQAGVRIALQPRGDESGRGHSSIRPARPRVDPISNVDPADEESSDGNDPGVRIRSEDLEPPAAEAATLLPSRNPRASRTFADSSLAAGRTGWNARQSASRTGAGSSAVARVPAEEPEPAPRSGASAAASEDPDEDGPNPLPPAIEAGAVSSLRRAPRSEDKLIRLARNEPDSASSPPQPSSAEQVEASAPADDRPRPRPTWRDLALADDEVPLDESLERTSGATRPAESGVITLTKKSPAPAVSRFFSSTQPLLDQAIKQSVCRIDPVERRLVDLKLPDLQAKLVSLHDIDADVILLDFWGSWCAPCRKSISHLIELQSKLPGKRFQVVGIACEKAAAAEDRRASAAQAVHDLGINYPVLLSSMDGTCPVQQALLVQFYPTLVLVDRDGRILAREQGATDATLPRMDRAIAAALRSHAN